MLDLTSCTCRENITVHMAECADGGKDDTTNQSWHVEFLSRLRSDKEKHRREDLRPSASSLAQLARRGPSDTEMGTSWPGMVHFIYVKHANLQCQKYLLSRAKYFYNFCLSHHGFIGFGHTKVLTVFLLILHVTVINDSWKGTIHRVNIPQWWCDDTQTRWGSQLVSDENLFCTYSQSRICFISSITVVVNSDILATETRVVTGHQFNLHLDVSWRLYFSFNLLDGYKSLGSYIY